MGCARTARPRKHNVYVWKGFSLEGRVVNAIKTDREPVKDVVLRFCNRL